MTRILVLYDSHSGRTGALARSLAEGADATGSEVQLARVPPLDDAATLYGPGAEDATPLAEAQDLLTADGIAFGTPVHLGAPSPALARFAAETGRAWMQRGLAGKVGTAFAAAGSGGGSETALVSLWSLMASHGMILVPGVPEAAEGPGGGPMGTVALGKGLSEADHARARAQGASLASVAAAVRASRQG